MKRMTRRQFAAGALAAMVSGSALAKTAADAPASADPLWFVDPDLRPEARAIQAMAGPGSDLTRETLPMVRRTMEALGGQPLPDVPVRRESVPVGGEHPDVAVYVINERSPPPRGGGTRPAILHLHGGGFVAGSARASLPVMQALARRLDCLVVSVEYRLAPETTWRGSIADTYAALSWLHAQAGALGVDPARVVVMGESAGGGHASLLAIAARQSPKLPIAFQLLVYPMLDDRTGSTRMPAFPIGTIGWTAAANRFAWGAFLGTEPGGSAVPSAAVPARLEDMAGLPPAFVGVGSIDLFFEESVVYASRLIKAGIPAELVVVPGAFHGFDVSASATPVAQRFDAARTEALRRALQSRA
ncbi:acetyl esterase/lipase [Aureimonas pseudogalii]|uniref:Acetyl esterase/lipase n=2 Tax=Aureimonas pseudogalii TaxID=1744844 RepID=A0A7W6H765_9HYPH|nr:acetyl esterase/lipase [Aureimonas pseudogalii]